MKNLHIIIIIVGFVCSAGCSSPDSKKNGSEAPTDSVQNDLSIEQDSSFSDTTRHPSLNQNKTNLAADSLITKRYETSTDVDHLDKKSGILRYSGNEPFVVPTLYESDSSAYRLIADETFMKETFKSLTGKRVTLYGTIQKLGRQTALKVHYYQLHENQSQQ